jgi:glycosyltransferase involved in cell wall biosynthesis
MRYPRIAIVAPMIVKSATGLSTYINEVVPRLCDAGCQVTVLASDCAYAGVPAGELVEIDRRATVKLFRVNGWLNRRVYRSPELTQWLNENLADFDVADIHGVWYWMTAEAARVCRKAGVPYVITPHGMMGRWDWAKRPFAKRIFYHAKFAQCWHSAGAIRFLTPGEVEQSMIAPEAPFVIIPNAVEPPAQPDRFAAERARLRLKVSDTAPIVLFVGRVTEQKGVIEIIKAFDLTHKQCPDAVLAIGGPLEGEYGQAVLQVAQTVASRDQIRVLGPVWGQDKRDLLEASALFITLSRNEGQAKAAIEALTFGVPAILTVDSNIAEVGEFNAGVITELDPVKAGEVMTVLLRDRKGLAEMSANARRLANCKFSWNAVLPQLVDLYSQVASGSRSGRSSMMHAPCPANR